MKTVLSVLFIISLNSVYAQMDSVVVKERGKYEFAGVYRSAVSVHGGGLAGIAGVNYDVLLSPHWGFEVGGGYPALGFGFDYYPWKIQRGKVRMRMNTRTLYIYSVPAQNIGHAVNIGMTWFLMSKINLGLDAGIGYTHTIDNWAVTENSLGFAISAKVGYRFSFRYMKRKRELEKKLAKP